MPNRGGRPARLSRDFVIHTAIELLDRDGLDAITMTRVAKAVDSSPMALYRHVSNREDLLESMLDELMRRIEIDLPEDAPWQENIRAWMANVRSYFLRYPKTLSLLDFQAGSSISPSWLKAVGELIPPLRSAGFSETDLAKALLWTSRITLGGILQEIPAPISDTAALVGGLGALPGNDSVRWIDVLPALERLDDEQFFRMSQDQTVQTLEAWLADSISADE